jgi:hypothetical protein
MTEKFIEGCVASRFLPNMIAGKDFFGESLDPF